MTHSCDSFAYQIRFLLQSLNEENGGHVFEELCEFVDYGIEGSVLLFETCLDYLSKAELKNPQLEDVFASLFKHIFDRPNFCTIFCQSLRSTAMSEAFLENLSNTLHFSASEKIGIGLALLDSEHPEFRTCGKNFCIAQIEELSANPVPMKSVEQIQNIIMYLHQAEGLCPLLDSFIQMLSVVHLEKGVSFVLAPFLSDELHQANLFGDLNLFCESSENDFDAILAEMEKERTMENIMMELGYGCTVNASQCKEILCLFLPLTEATIARLLGTISRTQSGLEDNQATFIESLLALGGNSLSELPLLSSWNIEILIDSVTQLAPGTNWIGVIEKLDHEGFYVPNSDAFSFLMAAYRYACPDQFPLHAICGSVWKNVEGQLSFLKYAVSAPPEIFTFAHSARQLAYVDAVYGHKFQLGHANHAWLCIDLLNVLCQLAERGHGSSVKSMLEYPLKHCPEILLLGLAHVHTACNVLQYEVSSVAFPLIVGNSIGNGMILHLWHVNPDLVLRGFVDVHIIDPSNMTIILDICKELKILSQVLDLIPSPFSIRLAALASQNELVDLEKWLGDNLTTYKDIFFEECLKFLRDIHFGAAQVSSGAIMNVYSETSSTFLKVLHAHTGLVSSSQLSEEMERLHVTIMRANPKFQSCGATGPSISDRYAKDIEAESNSYFLQMYSCQLTVDAIVLKLSQFKESSEKREQLIYECMIANLFEECKFFPKYPERQLRIAAVLFGSVISHQLVTHLSLGIALRYVLDAIRKPPDAKMFVFGTKALEQFADRLVEWPQYCNHILQISHLRNTHPDLVAFVERTLARVSLGHLESDGGNNSDDQPNGPTQLPSVNMEMSATSLQSLGASSTQPGHPSSPPLQHRLQSAFDDGHKASVTLANSTKPLVSPTGQPLVASSGDATSMEKSLSSINAPATVSSSPASIRPLRGITSTRFGSALNIETLVAASERRETPIEAPALEIQDKISFIINNISAANVEAKAKEFTEIFKEQYYPWFAQYMVMKRASIEPNFHDLYLKFLDKFNSKAMNKEIVQATYENCRVLLGSELIKSSSEERSLLKNLGSWLGKFTIGRNQVLKAREIDPKSLIIEAYEKGLMIAVVPFTSKILEPCRNSIAYQPPNPWTMGILGLLAEIYVLPNLKMNLKFDIEVLFKNLGVDMKDITPTSLLENRPRQVEGNPDFSNKDIGASHPPMISEVKSGIVSTLNKVELAVDVANPHSGGHTHLLSQYAAPFHLPAGTLMEDEKLVALRLSDQLPSAQGLLQATPSQLQATPSQLPFSVSQSATLIPNIGNHVIINQKIGAFGLHLHFQRVAPIAMDRAVKEILTGMVPRSVNIASQTTKELVLKDYAMESDETLIYNAAHVMVSNLAASLAHVTCKEPLRASLARQLGNLLQGLSIANERLEQAVQLVTNDNLDKACAEIERAAAEMAVQAIDKELEIRLSLRRKHREGIGSTFFEGSMYTQGSMAVLPEALRPKPGHLSLSQQQVYEGFVQLPRQNQSNESSNMLPADSAPAGGVGQSVSHSSALVQLDSTIYSSNPGNSGLTAVSQSLDFVTEDLDSTSVPLSASSTHTGMGDGLIKHISENDSVVASFPSTASASDLHSLEPSNAVKELGAASQPFPASVASERLGSGISENLVTRDALDKYQIVAEKLEALVTNGASESELQGIVAEVPEIILKCASRDEAALAVAQKVFKGLYADASNSSHVAAYIAILVAIRDLCKLVVKELTSWVIYSDEERKFNKDIIISLIRSDLLNLAEYNVHMAKLLDGGRHKSATEFAFSLLQTLVIEERGVISELPNLIDAIAKIASKPGSPESLQQLIEIVKNPVANMDALSVNSLGKEDKTKQSRDKKAPIHSAAIREEHKNGEAVEQDPAGLREQVSMLFAEWCRICDLPGANDAACAHYVLQLHQNGLLKGEHISDRFFHLLMEISISHCLSSEAISTGPLQSHQQVHSLSFYAVDIFAKLVLSILKCSPVDQGLTKFNLISKILAVTVRFIQKDAEEKKVSFNPRPYFRLFINWLSELGSPDPVFDGANFQVLITFANAFHALQPLKIPGFSFAWLELVSHRSFMPKLLTGNPSKGWPYLHRLLVDLFQFMEPFLRNAILGEPVHLLYRGTLRVLLVLLHDFPEFLCGYHFTFCDVIPPSCIQMRNIILSAFPRNMRLPDPSTPNLKIDLLAEIGQSPLIFSDVDAALKVKQMKTDVDEYLKLGQQGSSFLSGLKQRLLLLPSDAARAGTHYNIPLINSLVLYVGMQAMQQTKARAQPHSSPLAGFLVSAPLDIFQTLLAELDTEGRYLFLNAVANQLRYPNTHTHYFSFILLYLFAESNQEIIPEQITRVLLERLIVSRPHPWGLLITFIELIKNPRYNFWNRSFIRCAPEIEKLFDSVSRSCGGANVLDESTVSGGFSENMH